METTFTALIHGDSGVGKSWLGDTAPYPRLILDAEGRARYTPSKPKVWWDPRAGAPPVADGTWSTCVVNVHDFDTLSSAYQWLRSGQHQFKSVVLDSLMEAQKRCIDSIAGVKQMDQQDWGDLLRRMESLVRSYRDLTLLPGNATKVVVLIVGSKDDDGKKVPLLQGQLRDTIPYYIDLVGYYFKQAVVAADGTTAWRRDLLIDQQPGFIAKDNTGRLISAYGPIISEPNIEQLVELLHINGNGNGQEVAA